MQNARMLGNYVAHLADKKGLSFSDLGEVLGSYASFSQISALAKLLGAPVQDLLRGDAEQYNKTVVDCMNDFQDPANREKILDLIDDYIDVVDAVSSV